LGIAILPPAGDSTGNGSRNRGEELLGRNSSAPDRNDRLLHRVVAWTLVHSLAARGY
jgi:hypothetical protein